VSDTTLEMETEEAPNTGIVFEDAPPPAGDPDMQALTETQNGLREREAALARERDARVQAEREGQTAREQLARVEAARVTERKAALQAELDAAKTARDMAQQAYRVAREAGDIDAELNAQELLTGAIGNIRDVERQLSAAPEAPQVDRHEAPRPAPQPHVMSKASRDWIAAHPRFDSDPVYRQATVAAHMQAVQQGVPVDSPEYFQHIEGRLAVMFDEPTTTRPRQTDRPLAAPPSRGDQSAAATRAVDTVFGPMRVSKGAGGAMKIGFANQQQRENLTEAARFNGFVDNKTGKVDLGGYCKSLIEDAERSGGALSPVSRI
jgi:hypothetical protein